MDRFYKLPKLLDEKIVPPPKGFTVESYVNSTIHMYKSNLQKVTLLCNNDVMNGIIDHFGEGVDTHIYDNEHFVANVFAPVNNIFFSYIFGFGGKVSIMGPNDIKEKYKEMVLAEAEKIRLEDKHNEKEVLLAAEECAQYDSKISCEKE